MTASERVARLEQRLARERAARQEAEEIAERGLRALYNANQTLDQRIAARTRELEIAIARAEAASAARSSFLAHISHEVRTPLNGIAGMLELLSDEITSEDGKARLASARESTDRLEQLFARTLRVVELESDDLRSRTSPRDVEATIERAAERWRHRCAGRGQLLSVEIATPAGCLVRATDELDEALDELLDNVVTHADAGAVAVGAETEDGEVRFQVEDSGPGLPLDRDADDGEILDPGTAPATRRTVGAGIGLALVDRIASALGGQAGVENGENGGVRAWFTVPITVAG